MNANEICNIREWAPLTVIERIPARIQKGLFPANLNLTCVDAIDDFLALGSDAGIVFWYNRQTGDVQKLRAESPARITCVKIVDSVEYMIAAGSCLGQVSVFQIQKAVPEDLNLVAPCTKTKPIQRYTIRDLHESSVSCCEWSKNGMKLYSGDRQGIVVFTEFDYQSQLSKSIEVLKESYEIVQLNVQQSSLLVSTLYRNIICQKNNTTGEWKITQIGKKERKQLTDCGGIFLKKTKTDRNPLILCGRPGLRFWLADCEGNVEKTLIFRDAIQNSPLWEIPILNPKNSLVQRPKIVTNPADCLNGTQHFHNLYLYAGLDSMIVTHDENSLFILNLEKLRLEAVAKGCRKILDFCVNGKEIFILEGERSLIRLAPMPEKPNKTAKVIFNPLMPPPVPILGLSRDDIFEAPVEYEPEEQDVINAEECFELPPIENLNLNIPIELAIESPRAEQNRRLEIFQQIAEQDFDAPIVHHSELTKSSKSKRSKSSEHRNTQVTVSEGIVEIAKDVCYHVSQSNGNSPVFSRNSRSMKGFTLTNKPTEMNASFCSPSTSIHNSKKIQMYSQHLPDLLSPTTLQKEIASKAKNLAEELDLPQVCLAEITAEELKESQALAAPPPPPLPALTTITTPTITTSAKMRATSTLKLTKAYPTNVPLNDDIVTSSPKMGQLNYQSPKHKCKNSFSNEEDESGVYSDGQPIDELCSSLALIVKNDEVAEPEANSQFLNSFISAQLNGNKDDNNGDAGEDDDELDSGEIHSFLLDFSKAKDPLLKNVKPRSADSNSSSEWEFLDN